MNTLEYVNFLHVVSEQLLHAMDSLVEFLSMQIEIDEKDC